MKISPPPPPRSPQDPRGTPSRLGGGNTRAVYLAAKDLRQALSLPEDQRPARVRQAKEWLLSASDQQGREAAALRAQYFSAPPSTPAKAVSTADALASILADAQVGDTLIAAGGALGEQGATPSPQVLDDALLRMQSAPDLGVRMAALHFAAEATHSADLPSATKTLRDRAEETLQTLVSQAHQAGGAVVDQLARVDAGKALEALSKLGGPLARLPELGVFIQKGIEKIRGAMQTLIDLLGRVGLSDIRDRMTKIWNKLTDGTFIDSLLGWAFDRQPIENAVSVAAAKTSLTVSAIDSASDLLPPLGEGYTAKMTWAKTLSGLIAAAAGMLLTFGVVAAGPVAEFSAGAYLLILAAIIVIGRDYAGENGLFHQGKGILGVIEAL